MNPKLLLALVILLVVLFLGGMGLGFTRNNAAIPDSMPSWIGKLAQMLGGEQRVEADDVQAADPPACLAQWQQREFVLHQGESCLLDIGESSAPVRTVALELRQGLLADVLLIPAGEEGVTVRQSIEAGEEPARLQIFEDGGRLILQCIEDDEESECRIGLE